MQEKARFYETYQFYPPFILALTWFGVLTSIYIAYQNCHLFYDTYFPYISDAGGLYPEAIYFSFFGNIQTASYVYFIWLYANYLKLRQKSASSALILGSLSDAEKVPLAGNFTINSDPKTVSKISKFGYLGCFGLLLVVNFPSQLTPIPHYLGAAMTMLCLISYMLLISKHLIQKNQGHLVYCNSISQISSNSSGQILVTYRYKLAKFSIYFGLVFLIVLPVMNLTVDKYSENFIEVSKEKQPICYSFLQNLSIASSNSTVKNVIRLPEVTQTFKILSSIAGVSEWCSITLVGVFFASFRHELADLDAIAI